MNNQTMKSQSKPKTVELNVNPQYDINALLFYALPLCIFLANEKLWPWFYENFVEIFSQNYTYFDPQYQIEREYFAPGYLCDMNAQYYNHNFYANLAEEICLGYDILKREPDITPFLIEQIQNGYYGIIFLDEFYLPDKETYQQEHFVHESLIYGYDDREKYFMAIGFDANHSFGKLKYSYRQVSKAFAAGQNYYQEYHGEWAEKMAVRLIKPFDFNTEYPFGLERYLVKLNRYRLAEVDPLHVFWLRLPNEAICHFGIAVYDAVIYHLRKILKGRVSITPKEVHFLYEHKKYLYHSLNYINQRFMGGGLDESLAKYLEVVKAMDNFRLFFYKNSLKKRPDLKAVGEMIQKVEKLKEDETVILAAITAGVRSKNRMNRLAGGQ